MQYPSVLSRQEIKLLGPRPTVTVSPDGTSEFTPATDDEPPSSVKVTVSPDGSMERSIEDAGGFGGGFGGEGSSPEGEAPSDGIGGIPTWALLAGAGLLALLILKK